jgi:hypothetical protein
MNSFLNHESFPSVASLRRQPSVITTHDGRNTQIKRKYEEWTKDVSQSQQERQDAEACKTHLFLCFSLLTLALHLLTGSCARVLVGSEAGSCHQ